MTQYSDNPKEAYDFLGQYITELNEELAEATRSSGEFKSQNQQLLEELKQKNSKIVELSREVLILQQQLFTIQYE